MGDYFDQIADRAGSPRPPPHHARVGGARAAPMALSHERVTPPGQPPRSKRDLRLVLRYLTVDRPACLNAARLAAPVAHHQERAQHAAEVREVGHAGSVAQDAPGSSSSRPPKHPRRSLASSGWEEQRHDDAVRGTACRRTAAGRTGRREGPRWRLRVISRPTTRAARQPPVSTLATKNHRCSA